MKSIEFSSTFKKSYKKIDKKYRSKFDEYITALANGDTLPASAKDHQLHGRMKDSRSFKLDNNLRVVYQISPTTLYLNDIGTHSIYESIQEKVSSYMKNKEHISMKEASIGDIKLRKMIFVYTPNIHKEKYPEIEEYYDEELSGYYIEWDYIYNKITYKSDSQISSHSDMIDSLPFDIKKLFRSGESGVWGRDDYLKDKINSFVSDRPSNIPEKIYQSVKSKFIGSYHESIRIKESTSPLKTLKGSIIKRSPKYGVGKEIGGQIYFHKDYAEDICPNLYDLAKDILEDEYPNFTYNCLMYDKKKPDTLRFDEAPDFDTAREPMPGNMLSVNTATGEIVSRSSNQIWHHKWLWVKDDYTGFDVQESYDWSKKWLEKISSPSGYKNKWEAELKKVGLE